jgi:hypothetical protein
MAPLDDERLEHQQGVDVAHRDPAEIDAQSAHARR